MSRARRPLLAGAALALAALLAAAVGVLSAQARQPGTDLAVDGDAIAFRHLGVDQGLPSGSVQSLVQDALGFVWVGTDAGLARYDGATATSYLRSDDPTSLSGSVVQALAAGDGGVVWAGTSAGLDRYDPASDRFLRVSGLPSQNVRAVEADGAGGVWVGTAGGLAHVTARGTVDLVERADAGLPREEVSALWLAPGGDLWVGTRGGLARRRDGRYQAFRPAAEGGQRGLNVSALAPSGRGALLVGTMGSGLWSVDPASGQFAPLDIGADINAQNVTDVYEDAGGTTWVSTLGGGLRRLTPGADGVRVYEPVPGDPGSLSGDDVSALMEDRQGILWVGTFSGLDRFDRARGTALRLRHDPADPASLSSNDVRAVLRTDDGLWVATDRSLDRSPNERAFDHLAIEGPDGRALTPTALHQDRQGAVWVGTDGDGVYRARGAEVERGPRAGQTGGVSVTSMLDTRDGQFWVGTRAGGLMLVDRETGRSRVYRQGPSGLASDRVGALAEDASGALWVGTGAGLCRLDRAGGAGAFTCLRPDPDDPAALADGAVLALHARRDGTLWVGTEGGFHRLDTDDVAAGFTRYRAADTDLPGDAVLGIVEDETGFLWLSTSGGLTRFEPVTEAFYRRLGTQGADLSLNGAAALAPDGQLFFGSTRGLLAFYPQNLRAINANPPEVILTGVQVAGQRVEPQPDGVLEAAAPVADEIRLGPDQAYLTIQYAGLHFSDPAANTYRYRMAGLYDDWREVGTTREATFSSLPAGDYTFEVQSANADGVGFGDRTASIAVHVAPPWWRTWWALLAFAGLALFGLVQADRWQRTRLLHQERERAERREAELRAETAEVEHRKATAEAAALKAENDRKAAEIERTRDVQAANDKLAQANLQLEASLRDLRETQAQLVQSEKLASLGQLTAGIAHEIKNPLNFVNNFADLSVELAQELRQEMAEAGDRPSAEVLDELGPILDDLQDNARRIHEHGQRADRIVRSMLLHSRGGANNRGRVVVNTFVDEYLNLAFHGARANESDFQVEVARDFDDAAGEAEIVPQEFGRVLINLLTNAFHAVGARARADGPGYTPTVTARTRRDGDQVTVEVADNGTGISDAVKAKIFEPFFTTKPSGEGTGLGLSLAHDIVTQVHGGRMELESVEGEGTVFRVVIPATAAERAA